MTKREDIINLKPGTVYAYGNLSDDLYLVTRMLNRKPGSHVWLCLTGSDVGFEGEESDPLTHEWEQYEIVWESA